MNDTLDYLKELDISKSEKNFVSLFEKKNAYLNSIAEMYIKNNNLSILHTGYGNVNSNIAVIFESQDLLEEAVDNFNYIMDKMQCGTWNIYTTFISKTKRILESRYEFLVMELIAVSPKIIYIFSDGDISEILKQIYDKLGASNKFPIIKIIPYMEFASMEQKELGKFWSSFKDIINYKNITER